MEVIDQFWQTPVGVDQIFPEPDWMRGSETKALQAVVRRGQYLTRSLGTADPREADKRAPAVLAEPAIKAKLIDLGGVRRRLNGHVTQH